MNELINYRFINKLNPFRIALVGIFFYLFVFIITPAHVSIHLIISPFIYIFFAYIFFGVGTFTISFKRINHVPPLKINKKRDYMLICVFLLAIIGVLLRIYDRLYLRGASITANLFENREAMLDVNAGPISIVSTLLYPLVYFNLFWVLYHKYDNKLLLLISIIIFFFPTYDGILLGNRSSILHNIIVLFLILKITNNLNFTWKKAIVILLFITGFLFLSLHILEERISYGAAEFNYDFTYPLYYSDYNTTFQVNNWYANDITNGPHFFQLIKFLLIHVGQYIVHGIFEFNYLIQYYNHQNLHTWGTIHFLPYLRVIPFLDTSELQALHLAPREGVYLSFFGDVYIDFGWYGLIFMYFFGLFNKYLWIKVKEGKIIYVPVYLFMVFVIFFMPTANLITGGMGLIFINSLFIPIIITAMKKIVMNKTI